MVLVVRYQSVTVLANSRAGFRQKVKSTFPFPPPSPFLVLLFLWPGACLELSWEPRTLLTPSLARGCSYQMPSPVRPEDFVTECNTTSALSLAYRGCQHPCSAKFRFTHFLLSKTVSPLSGDSLSSFLKWLKSLTKLLAV